MAQGIPHTEILRTLNKSVGPSYVAIKVPINWVLVVSKRTANNKTITSKQISLETRRIYTECKYGGPLGWRPGRVS